MGEYTKEEVLDMLEYFLVWCLDNHYVMNPSTKVKEIVDRFAEENKL